MHSIITSKLSIANHKQKPTAQKKILQFFTMLCTFSNLLSLPVLHSKLQCPYLPENASSFSNSIIVLVTSDTTTYTYSPETKYKVAKKIHIGNN